ncbi:DUF222 domain-containing protein [Corynebacterium casei]|nr:HNH endonuclease signature motif containing protein [Corynebacterium casei]MDN5840824.1 HNH endonuclease [Corynebacterium casei]MDN6707835.1 HNH endonuclease [Corynebacterium casei]
MTGYNPTSRTQDPHSANAIIRDSIEHIRIGLINLQAAMHSVDTLKFHDIYLQFEELEELFGKKTFIDAAFAFLAERDDAGRMVSSSHATEYLIKHLGLSYGTAMDRLRNAQTIFGEDVKPDPGPEPTPRQDPEEPAVDEAVDEAADNAADEAAREQAEQAACEEREEREARQREADERAERENDAKARNREKIGTGSIPADVLSMIDYELKQLDRYAQPGTHELRAIAIDKAKKLSKTQLKNWLRSAVRKANANAVMPNGEKDHTALTKKREFIISKPDAEGMVSFRGKLDPTSAAILMKAMSPAARPGFDKEETGFQDNRSLTQRRADQLTQLCSNFMTSRHPDSGLSSIVVSATRQELENLSPNTLLPTDTGIFLTPLDLVRLGAAGSDFLCIMDDTDFQPLAFGRSKRTATLAQKIALIASEMVCSHDGCETAAMNCDVHHIVAWSFQGVTDLKNLTLRCRRHHGDNNDAQDFRRNMAHAARCPDTGRAGTQYPRTDGLKFNDSTAAQQSAHHKLKHQDPAEPEHLASSAHAESPPPGGAPGGPPGSSPPASRATSTPPEPGEEQTSLFTTA